MEIKFRGMRVENNEWVYGHYFYNENGNVHNITDGKIAYPVRHDSIGQFRNKKDINNVEIYNGDIVKTFWNNREMGLKLVENDSDIPDKDIWYGSHNESDTPVTASYEVVGNITENPELLKPKIEAISVSELKRERVKEVFRKTGIVLNDDIIEEIIEAVNNPFDNTNEFSERTRYSLTSRGIKTKLMH